MPRQVMLSDQLRRAIQASRFSVHRIAEEAGIDESVLSRFMAGEPSLSLDDAGKALHLLGFQVLPPSRLMDFIGFRSVRPPRRRG